MASKSNDNVVPLVEAVVAYRNRLIERERQSSVVDFVAIKDTTQQIALAGRIRLPAHRAGLLR